MILKKYYALFTGLLVFILYLFTMAPSIVQIDSGELAAVQCTLGIAHPTGYPLFTIIGFFFQSIPFSFSKIYTLNLLAGIWCSLGVIVITLAAKLVLDNQDYLTGKVLNKAVSNSKSNKNKRQSENLPKINNIDSDLREKKKIISAVACGLLIGFSKTFWSQSTSVEVYSLQIFLLSCIIYFLLKAFFKKGKDLKNWIILSIVVAFGFANHMTTILLLPGIAYLYFNKFGFTKISLKKALILILCSSAIIILFYLYLPIRASQQPSINWGNPINFERIYRHISGKQYQVWLFSSTDAAKKQLIYFINNLPSEFAIVGLLFCLVGFFNSLFTAKKIFVFLLICFLSTVLYSINYEINDIDSYFLLAYISLSFFAVFGIQKIFYVLKSSENSLLLPIAAVSLLLTIQVYINFNKVDQHDVTTFEEYSKALLRSTQKNSVILTYQWDYLVSPSYYLQNVENFRKDLTIIDKELLRRSWYYNQLQVNHPDIAEKIKNESALFINAVLPFERGGNFDPNLLEKCYRNIMTNLTQKVSDSYRTFYIAPELVENEMRSNQFSLPNGYFLVPDLFLFKVVKTNDYVPAADPNFTIKFPKIRNHYVNFIENLVGSMLVRRAMYEMHFNKTERAKIYIDKVKSDFPNYQIPYNLGDVIQ